MLLNELPIYSASTIKSCVALHLVPTMLCGGANLGSKIDMRMDGKLSGHRALPIALHGWDD
eukprot:4090460-Amphidinium_carterae.1